MEVAILTSKFIHGSSKYYAFKSHPHGNKETKILSHTEDKGILDQRPYYIYHLLDGDLIPSTYAKALGIEELKLVYPVLVKEDNPTVHWAAGAGKLHPWLLFCPHRLLFCDLQAKNGVYLFKRFQKRNKQTTRMSL